MKTIRLSNSTSIEVAHNTATISLNNQKIVQRNKEFFMSIKIQQSFAFLGLF